MKEGRRATWKLKRLSATKTTQGEQRRGCRTDSGREPPRPLPQLAIGGGVLNPHRLEKKTLEDGERNRKKFQRLHGARKKR